MLELGLVHEAHTGNLVGKRPDLDESAEGLDPLHSAREPLIGRDALELRNFGRKACMLHGEQQAIGVRAEHSHGHFLADRHHVPRIGFEVVAHLRDVHQADASGPAAGRPDRDEGAEVLNLLHGALVPLVWGNSLKGREAGVPRGEPQLPVLSPEHPDEHLLVDSQHVLHGIHVAVAELGHVQPACAGGTTCGRPDLDNGTMVRGRLHKAWKPLVRWEVQGGGSVPHGEGERLCSQHSYGHLCAYGQHVLHAVYTAGAQLRRTEQALVALVTAWRGHHDEGTRGLDGQHHALKPPVAAHKVGEGLRWGQEDLEGKL
mmetsp:Transcript_92673/g.299806  ORF Transcript_92673/g.299806 Transcript_92673/m.299806 type:complete len:316 (-) Transcript_92673:358-1305(-)